jgi:hypothetical protein
MICIPRADCKIFRSGASALVDERAIRSKRRDDYGTEEREEELLRWVRLWSRCMCLRRRCVWVRTILHLCSLHLPICMQLLKTRGSHFGSAYLGPAAKPIVPGAIGVYDLA